MGEGVDEVRREEGRRGKGGREEGRKGGGEEERGGGEKGRRGVTTYKITYSYVSYVGTGVRGLTHSHTINSEYCTL